jgi:hypothetical protein
VSCNIAKETRGFIPIDEELMDELKDFCRSNMSNADFNTWDYEVVFNCICNELELLVPKYVSKDDYSDLVNYCDTVTFYCEC